MSLLATNEGGDTRHATALPSVSVGATPTEPIQDAAGIEPPPAGEVMPPPLNGPQPGKAASPATHTSDSDGAEWLRALIGCVAAVILFVITIQGIAAKVEGLGWSWLIGSSPMAAGTVFIAWFGIFRTRAHSIADFRSAKTGPTRSSRRFQSPKPPSLSRAVGDFDEVIDMTGRLLGRKDPARGAIRSVESPIPKLEISV